MLIQFTIHQKPFGKKNMRPFKMGKRVSLFSPSENSNYISLVQHEYINKCEKQFGSIYRFKDDEPLKMRIVAYYPIPKSTSKKKKYEMEAGNILPIIKPDTDNISKAICDALNGLAFRDDSQIVSLKVNKLYSDSPCVEVELENYDS